MDEQKQDNEAQEVREENINLDVDQPSEQQVAESLAPPEDEKLIPAEAQSLHHTTKRHSRTRTRTLVVVCAILALTLAVVGVALALTVFKDDGKSTETAQAPKVTLMGAELTIADGYVQTGPDNTLWEDAKAGDQITEGTYIRTQPSARAVIALDDGSAIRINSSSVVKIDSLDPEDVAITNISGEVYTRVVKSDRQFSVAVAGEEYVALGTAYKTVNTVEVQGVEVYESTVKLTKATLEVPEGKYYYSQAAVAEQNKKLADIPVEKIKQDAFVAWNYEQDKNNSEFKDKLGYLTKIDEPVVEQKPAAPTKPTSQTAAASVKLVGTTYDTGVKLSWKLSNVSAPNGFKIVKSLSANPTYGKDDAVYVKSGTSSYAWKLKDGKTYHFRVCIYSGEGCSLYSNNITVTAPVYVAPDPTGTPVLSKVSGNDVSWTLDGKSPDGFKLVWSTNSAPVYPGNDYEYYGSDARSGTIAPKDSSPYYVRVCTYKSGTGCISYSNEVTITPTL